jgi:hypothetical protein
MTDPSDEIRDPLEGLTAEMFRKTVYPGTDALMVFVPEGKKPSPEVQKILDEAGSQRWFPVEGGNTVKCPFVTDTYDESLFKLEKGGWDHEHCDTCGCTIDVGDSCWVTEEADEFFLICDVCHQKLRTKEQS